jgi:hypothetical protein
VGVRGCAQIGDTNRDFLIPVGVRGASGFFVADTRGKTKITPLVSGGEGPKSGGVFLTSSHTKFEFEFPNSNFPSHFFSKMRFSCILLSNLGDLEIWRSIWR